MKKLEKNLGKNGRNLKLDQVENMDKIENWINIENQINFNVPKYALGHIIKFGIDGTERRKVMKQW